jgi:hypothetical protein
VTGRCILAFLVCISSPALGAFEQSAHGGRVRGMGSVGVPVEGDFWAPFVNPSCLSLANGTWAAVEYVPGLFAVRELSHGAVAVGSSSSVGAGAVTFSAFGFDLYRELQAGISAAYELDTHVLVGIGLNLYSLAIRGYGNDMTVGLDVGVLIRLAPGVKYGVSLRNLNRPAIGVDQEPLPQSMSMGISILPITGAVIAVGADKDNRYPFRLGIGIEYCFEQVVSLRLGVKHDPSTISAGVGIPVSMFTVDYAYTMHPDLGGTHCLSLSFSVRRP